MKTSAYREIIGNTLRAGGRRDLDARHVEAYVRLERGTLDGLGGASLGAAIWSAVAELEREGLPAADLERLVRSFGLFAGGALGPWRP